jgi:ABC-type multidrug transport system permease subunit
MSGFWNHFLVTMRLNFRNIQAMVFGYIFPLFFLIVFGAYYRSPDTAAVPRLAGEIAQVLTITIMGGACFGMPVAIVSERDRGVWRRYRLAPLPTIAFVTSTMLARYVMVLTSALLQFTVAMVFYRMPLPARPVEMLIAFTLVSFAFLGLGLVISMVANSTTAVQGLGQIFFLPMIMIGGVGVKFDYLPKWALHVSAFLPGRYSVAAMGRCMSAKSGGLSDDVFSLIALMVMGLAMCLAASKMFRWEPEQKLTGKVRLWLVFCLIVWAMVGIFAEYSGYALKVPKGYY